MPYITQERRAQLDSDIVNLVFVMEKDHGVCNYVITRLLDLVLQPRNYADINGVIGVLECAKLEFYRRAAAPYEDQKIKENGDVY